MQESKTPIEPRQPVSGGLDSDVPVIDQPNYSGETFCLDGVPGDLATEGGGARDWKPIEATHGF